jgi:hypothetical protein
MPNKSSPHGGFISEGTVSHGTLRTQDLLRSFADELERVFPFNGLGLVIDARNVADVLDADPDASEDASDVLFDVIDQLNTIASREGLYFGAHEGDGSDFGYWRNEDDTPDYLRPLLDDDAF